MCAVHVWRSKDDIQESGVVFPLTLSFLYVAQDDRLGSKCYLYLHLSSQIQVSNESLFYYKV